MLHLDKILSFEIGLQRGPGITYWRITRFLKRGALYPADAEGEAKPSPPRQTATVHSHLAMVPGTWHVASGL